MIIGIPKEIKNNESRVGMTPAGVFELTKRNPKAVFCLISSLDFHGIGTQIPYSQWVSLPRGIKLNNNCDYNIKVIHPTKEIYNLGIENHMVNNIGIKVYSLSKTQS